MKEVFKFSRGFAWIPVIATIVYSASFNAVEPLSQTQPSSPQASVETSRKPAPPEQGTQEVPAQSCEEVRKNVQRLTLEVQRLRRRVADLEKDRQVASIQEQLTKEEQRGENLQLRLIDIAEREAGLQRSMEEVIQQLRPERLESALAGVGSTRPEDTREEIRRRLTSERTRLQAQLELLRQDRIRTQASLATTDTAIQRLRLKLAETQRP